jgi:uracil-DNA glycosylase
MNVPDWGSLRGTDWNRLLSQEFKKPYWAQLQAFVEEERSHYNVYPPPGLVFAALHLTQCAKTKVVIVGQDPYAGAGQAQGLCFSVPAGVRVPPSLANIFRELQTDVCLPMPDDGNLERWARQGVLLLNATLTVQAGAPGSHRSRGWETFTDAVIQEVAEKTDPAFILWGKDAQRKKAVINASPRIVIESSHPSPRSARKGFLGSKPFSRANCALAAKGRPGVDWSLTK